MNSLNFAIANQDIQLIVLDNLQFMTGSNTKLNKFDYQDEIIHKLRILATEKNVHIILVIHPRKTDEQLKVNSIFGTGKASQEADNIFIIQNFKGLRVIDVAKNRFNGNTGKSVLAFNKKSCRFFEVSDKDFMAYNDEQINLDDLIAENEKKILEEDTSIKEIEKYEVKTINEDINQMKAQVNLISNNLKLDLNDQHQINTNSDLKKKELNQIIPNSDFDINKKTDNESISKKEEKSIKKHRNINPDNFLVQQAIKLNSKIVDNEKSMNFKFDENIKDSKINISDNININSKNIILGNNEENSSVNKLNSTIDTIISSNEIVEDSKIQDNCNEKIDINNINTSNVKNTENEQLDDGVFFHNNIIKNNSEINSFHNEESFSNSKNFSKMYANSDNKHKYPIKKDNVSKTSNQILEEYKNKKI